MNMINCPRSAAIPDIKDKTNYTSYSHANKCFFQFASNLEKRISNLEV